jgi:hypothetical protein
MIDIMGDINAPDGRRDGTSRFINMKRNQTIFQAMRSGIGKSDKPAASPIDLTP